MEPQREPAAVARLRADLDAADYRVDALSALWGDVADGALHRGDRVPARRALETGARTPLGTLARLFVLGLTESESLVSAAVPRTGVDGLVALGLVVRDLGAVAPLVDLRPYTVADGGGVASWWVVSDLGELQTGGELREDHVLGVGSASLTLARIAVPTGGGRVLDLGTGCGIQALHAARTADEVVATDLSTRALAFAGLTAALNGVDRIDLRAGSLYEPVAGERFDRIVSNPPFVITPRTAGVPEYTYRDGGMTGDSLVEAVVRGAADHLEPGGIAQLLGNWEIRDGDPVGAARRVLGWAADVGLDAWVVERDRPDVALYAETWVRDGGTTSGGRRSEELIAHWLADFAARGVTAVGLGHITLRRPVSGEPSLARFEHFDGAGTTDAPAGAIAAGLAAHDALVGRDDSALADTVLRVAPDVTERRHFWPGAEHPTVIELHQGGGFGRHRAVGTALAAVVGACDGELPVGVLVDAVAGLIEEDPAELRSRTLPLVRELLVEGYLLHP